MQNRSVPRPSTRSAEGDRTHRSILTKGQMNPSLNFLSIWFWFSTIISGHSQMNNFLHLFTWSTSSPWQSSSSP
eukprot:s2580_g7.t1